MRVLAIDTCGAEATTAFGLVDAAGMEVLCQRNMPGRTASEHLIGEVGQCFRKAGWRPAEVEAVVIVHGPGSFTGVRVGVCAAKGLAEATGARLVALSRLQVLARLAAAAEGHVWAVLDAGRGELYCGVFAGEEPVDSRLRSYEEVRAGLRGGDVVAACEPSVISRLEGLPGLREVRPPDAADAMRLAAGRLLRGEFTDAAKLDGLYLRRTEAELLERMRAHRTATG